MQHAKAKLYWEVWVHTLCVPTNNQSLTDASTINDFIVCCLPTANKSRLICFRWLLVILFIVAGLIAQLFVVRTLLTILLVGVKPGIHMSTSWGWVTISRLGALVWTALWAEENRLGSSLHLIHRLSVHQREPAPSHGWLVFSVEDLCSCSLHYLAWTSWTEPTWPSSPQLRLVLRCIPGFIYCVGWKLVYNIIKQSLIIRGGKKGWTVQVNYVILCTECQHVTISWVCPPLINVGSRFN